MQKKKKMSVVSLLVAVFMLLSFVPTTVGAEDTDTTARVWDLSKSKEATNLDSNFESRVTLSLPADDYKGNLDVVFVMDGSTSTDASDLAKDATNLLKELTEYKNLNVKVGVVIFGGSVPILYTSEELMSLADEENITKLTDVITDRSYDSASGRSGSNLQAGVKNAQSMLDADTEVENSDKYMILLTDGGARMWVNDEGLSMSQGYTVNGGTDVWWGQNQDFASRYIEQRNPRELRTFEEVWQAGNTNADFTKYAMTQEESKKEDAYKNAATLEIACNSDDYYTSLEASTYYAATSIVESSEKCHVIWVDYPYHSGTYAEYTNSFKNWLADNKYVTRYDSQDQQSGDIFADVKDQLIYLLDAGTTVVDYMGYVEGDYNLDFVNKIDTLVLTVDGETKPVTQLSDNSYGFGDKLDNGKYEYELTYYAANDGEEYFQWDINVPVRKDIPVKLTYTVKLVNPKTASGTYGVYDRYGENNDGSAKYDLYTNNKATLNPVDSNGKAGNSQDFQKPTVSYVVESKVPSTGDNSHISLFVTLLATSTIALTAVAIKKKDEK